MTPDPPCCVPSDGLGAVADRLAESGGEIPVVADLGSRRFLGVVTALGAETFLRVGGAEATAADALTQPPVTVGPDFEALDAAIAMQEHWLRHLVVVDADVVVGTVSRTALDRRAARQPARAGATG